MMTSNIAECINSCLRHARQFPVTVLIEYIPDMMQKWFHDRRTFTDSLHTQLTPWAIKYLTKRNEESTFYTVRPIDWNEFEVKDGAKDGLVNLLDRICTCREFEIDLLPCAHALAALRACKRPFIDFCLHYYKKSSLVEEYAGVIRPVGHMSDWEIPDEISSLVVHPPEWKSQAGWPCKVRKKSKGEFRSRKGKTCSLCKQAGHNRQNCPNPLSLPAVDNICEPEPGPSRGLSRIQRKCRVCGELGHYRQTCPQGQTSRTEPSIATIIP
ncbi:hypothetical protein Dsin_007069 [Dipteronia sinensis]|uniref:CCHC-type domain-containing protein n=1 Tax=Dipteronia sinensis TaxID=43782 RepID=A0AAE0AZT5_9ROSI|nr:hypothetical protein Dsin_007069 [Dipteronia sinensis]